MPKTVPVGVLSKVRRHEERRQRLAVAQAKIDELSIAIDLVSEARGWSSDRTELWNGVLDKLMKRRRDAWTEFKKIEREVLDAQRKLR